MTSQAPAAGDTGNTSNSNEQNVAPSEGNQQAQAPENTAPVPPAPEMDMQVDQESQQMVPEDVHMAGTYDGETSDSARASQEASKKRGREDEDCQIINRPPQFKRGGFGRNTPASSSRGMTARGRGAFRAAGRGRRNNFGPVVSASDFGLVRAEDLTIKPQEGGTVSWNVAGADPGLGNMWSMKAGGAAFLHEAHNEGSTEFVTTMIKELAKTSSATHMVTTTQPAFNPYNSGTGRGELALADNRQPTPRELDPRAVCAHCHQQGHTVADCVGPPSQHYGDIRGCPRCNTREHHYDNCKKGAKGDAIFDQFYLITSRINKPPIRTTVDWVQMALSGRLMPSQGYPWSKNFALKQLKASRESRPWVNYDYTSDHYSELPVDPDTKDLEAIKKARSEGRLMAEMFTPQSATRAARQQTHADVPATQQTRQEDRPQAQEAVRSPAPVFYQAQDQSRQASAEGSTERQAFPAPAQPSSQRLPLQGSIFNPQHPRNLSVALPFVGLSPEQLLQETTVPKDVTQMPEFQRLKQQQEERKQKMVQGHDKAENEYKAYCSGQMDALRQTPGYRAASEPEQNQLSDNAQARLEHEWHALLANHQTALNNLAQRDDEECKKLREELSEKLAENNPENSVPEDYPFLMDVNI